VRTVRVEHRPAAVDVHAVGTVTYDETRQAEINTKIDGWIRDLRANYTGIAVRRGERLFTLYSPELLATQNEYLLALVNQQQHAQQSTLPETRDHAERLVQAVRDRLTVWDMSAAELHALEKRGTADGTIAVVSPASGVIVEKLVVEGMRVSSGQRLFRVADLSSVWVEAAVPERDIRFVRVGQAAAVTLDAYPGDTFNGRTSYIYPSVTEETRTVRVRVQLANPGGRLRPGMYAAVTIPGPPSMALVVPTDAVVDSGTQQLVFVAQGNGYFDPRPVKTGTRMADGIEIIQGLREGESVAAGATFFLDSESQLRGAVQNYQASSTPSRAPAHATLEIAFATEPDPPRTGAAIFEAMVKQDGTPLADASVSAVLSMPAMPSMNMPAMRSEATLAPIGGGRYRGAGQVTMAGRWDVTITVSRNGTALGSRQFSVVAR
jgi:Cu(I)/Ag(I) efflux system membrane fusion protein/cobalt-zinc-cadmium efflux system membrane fusion protein